MGTLAKIGWIHLSYALALALIGFIIAGYISRLINHAIKKYYSEQEAIICGRLVFFSLLFIFLITAMQQIGIQISAILGAAGVVTVALGFAAKTAASNFVSGVFLLFERPFKIGDTIQINTMQGTVKAIDLLSTKLKTSENTLIRIPNETINKSEITNLSHFKTRVLNIKLPVPYTIDFNKIKTVLLDLAKDDKGVIEKPAPEVTIGDFTSNALELNLKLWIHTHDASIIKHRLKEAIKQALEKNKIDIQTTSENK